jgi:hypothetical protein
MEKAPENSNETLHSAYANGMNEKGSCNTIKMIDFCEERVDQ